MGKFIIAGFAQSARVSKVLPDVGEMARSREGTTNMVDSSLALIRQAPESSAGLAELLATGGQLGMMDTTSFMKLVNGQDGDVSDRFVGLYPSLATLPPDQKTKLATSPFDVFRPELIRRHEADKHSIDRMLLDMIVDLTKLKKPVAGWQTVGRPAPSERTMWIFSQQLELTTAGNPATMLTPPAPQPQRS